MPAPETTESGCTIGALLRRMTAELRHAGIQDAGTDARRLMTAALGLSAAQLLGRSESAVSAEAAAKLALLVNRRRAREPVSRILGEREFYGRPFTISPATLDPRADSETMITVALELVGRTGWRSRPLRILDVGTGSGCLLLTLLAELPDASGVGIDVSAPALEVARHNACHLGVETRCAWSLGDALESVSEPFHILVSNPPYVRSGDIQNLDAEVSAYDPRTSLDGGPDGLQLYRRIAPRIRAVVPNGWIVLEVGCDQADAVADILMDEPCRLDREKIFFYHDGAGLRRCVAARTRN